MVQGGNRAPFAVEPLEGLWIVGYVRLHHLDGDGAVQARIDRLVDLAHPTFADARRKLIRANALACERSHGHRLVEQRGGRRVEEARRASVGFDHPLDLFPLRLVATARQGEVRPAFGRGQRQRVLEHLAHTRPILRINRHDGGDSQADSRLHLPSRV
jgi:hypothetical protein